MQWLTGVCVRYPFAPIAVLRPDGHLTLILPDRQIEERSAADEVIGYEAKWHSTTRDEQLAASSAVVMKKLTAKPKRVACEFEAFAPQLLLGWNATLVEIDAIVFDLRRHKDADELQLLTRANEANRAMYERGREIVRPGAERARYLFRTLFRCSTRARRAANLLWSGFSIQRARRRSTQPADSSR